MPAPLLITEPELAKMLQISQRSIRNARLSGLLSFVPIGRLVRYRIEDVTAFINSATVANKVTAPTVRKSKPRTVSDHAAAIRGFAQRDRKAA